MWFLRSVVIALAVFVTACGDETQTPTAPTQTPSQTQAPPPTAEAKLQWMVFEGSWWD